MAVLQAFSDASGLEPTPQLEFKQQVGEWRDTGSGPALTPQWGKVPLYLVSKQTTAYLPQELKALDTYTDLLQSPVYAAQMAETKRLGAAHAPSRTAEQTEIAFFWANDLNGTSKPPGQLYTIVQTVAKQQGTLADQGDGKGENSGQLQTARLFALVGTALVNASIVAWQAKYYWPTAEAPLRLWRPETAIQLATQDGNPSTVADPAWQPLSAMTSGARFSPNFPAFVSGHSTFGAAFAAAMQAFYGTDTIPFTATTEDPHAVKDENGIRRTRSFSSFTQAALENGRSRIYLGVHYQFDANGGFEIGTQVGQDTAQAFARRPEVASAARRTEADAPLPLASISLALDAATPNQLIQLPAGANDNVYILFALNTDGSWQTSSYNQVPLDYHGGGAQRVALVGSVAQLLEAGVTTWVITVIAEPGRAVRYDGALPVPGQAELAAVMLVQAAAEAEALAGSGTLLYHYPLNATLAAGGTNTIKRGVLTFI